jgi:hypothetical protein
MAAPLFASPASSEQSVARRSTTIAVRVDVFLVTRPFTTCL